MKFCLKIGSPLTPRISLSNLLSVEKLKKKHQYVEKTSSGRRIIVCFAKVRVHTVICSGLASSGAKKKLVF